MFLLVPAYPGCPGSKAVKRSLLLLFSLTFVSAKMCSIYVLLQHCWSIAGNSSTVDILRLTTVAINSTHSDTPKFVNSVTKLEG